MILGPRQRSVTGDDASRDRAAAAAGGGNPARLIAELNAGRLVITSVHPQIRHPHSDPPGTGGHLVLVTGHGDDLVTFHNPSGHAPEAVLATLPMPAFDRFSAHRGIALHLWP